MGLPDTRDLVFVVKMNGELSMMHLTDAHEEGCGWQFEKIETSD